MVAVHRLKYGVGVKEGVGFRVEGVGFGVGIGVVAHRPKYAFSMTVVIRSGQG